MTSNREEQFARRVIACLQAQTDVSDSVQRRLDAAREAALARARRRPEPVTVGAALAHRQLFNPLSNLWLWMSVAAVALYFATLALHSPLEPGYGWNADDDNSSYVELVRD